MARLPTSIRVLKNDTEGLNIQNTFNQAVYDAMAGQLTFIENIRCQIKEITFTTLSTYAIGDFTEIKFDNLLKAKAIGVILLQIIDVTTGNYIQVGVTVQWLDINGVITIRYISGLDDETQYTFRVMVI